MPRQRDGAGRAGLYDLGIRGPHREPGAVAEWFLIYSACGRDLPILPQEVDLLQQFPEGLVPGDYLEVKDAADALGVSPRRVRQLIVDGQLEAERAGGIWLVDRHAVENRKRHSPSPGRPVSLENVWLAAVLHEQDWADISSAGADLAAESSDEPSLRYRINAVLGEVSDEALLRDHELRQRLRVLLKEIDRHHARRAASEALAQYLIAQGRNQLMAQGKRDRYHDDFWRNLRNAHVHRGPSDQLQALLWHAQPHSALRQRYSHILNYRAHPGILERLASDSRIILSGARAAELYGIDIVPDERVDAYVAAAELPGLKSDYSLSEPEKPSDANVLLRVVEDSILPLRHGSEPMPAPRLLVAFDLLDGRDPRARRAGSQLLELAQAAHRAASGPEELKWK